MMTSVKEVNRLFRDAKRSFGKAIELAKRNLIVGEVNFPSEKKAKPRKKAAAAGEETSTP